MQSSREAPNALELAPEASLPESTNAPAESPDAPVSWAGIHQGEHFVQFYEDDHFLVQSVAGFIGEGLKKGENAIVIATARHREAIATCLESIGKEFARRCLALDAAKTLRQFMRNGAPDEELFFQTIGAAFDHAAPDGQTVRAFGEMVALLWADGKGEAALQLEELWNKLGRQRAFSLFCGYPLSAFSANTDAAAFMRICGAHARVLPLRPSDAARQHVVFTGLQKEAALLRTEIESRKSMEIELRRIASIVESSDDAILSKTLEGIILTWNNGAERIFGYKAAEVVGKPVTILIPAERHNEEPIILDRIRRGERIDHYETVRQRKDGSLVDISLTVSPIRDAEGRVIAASKIARDITDRKRAEREIREARNELARANQDLQRRVEERTASLQEALSQLEEFSYTVSHDLRAPLRGMQIYSTALLEDFQSVLPAEAIRYLNKITHNAALLDKMILDVLSFSRISRAELQWETVSLDTLVAGILEHSDALQFPNADIQVEPLLPVHGHAPSLSQALSNLLANAVKFVPPGVQPKVRVWTETRGKNVRLSIQDNGIGIDPKYHHRLFNMFERIHPNLPYEGTGVGLAIAAKAVQRMNGRIGVESNGSNGSRFWIEVPAATEKSQRESVP